MTPGKKRIVFWGTYDKGKPRVRLLLAGAKSYEYEIIECHSDVWRGVEDKSQLHGLVQKVKRIFRIVCAYPVLLYRYLRLPSHDVVVVGYMGQFDVLVICLFARLRRVPVIWDVFLSLYDTVVHDRKLVSKISPAAAMLYALEWLGSRAAATLILDTRAHAAYFESLYHLPSKSVRHIFVGAELDLFKSGPVHKKNSKQFIVLFYGQFIPLHGIETILRAAGIVESRCRDVVWRIIGRGQETDSIDALQKELGLRSIERIDWVKYEDLIVYISDADVCLGIFGTTGKAGRVIPNKAYQILAAGKPLITADTPAVRELFKETPTVRLIEPGNPSALAVAVMDMRQTLQGTLTGPAACGGTTAVGFVEVGNQLAEVIEGSVSPGKKR